MGKKVTALITDMNQPLGTTVGNALEIQESLAILNGKGPADTQGLTLELAKRMLYLAGIKADCFQALEKGSALQKFEQMVACHGGDLSAERPTAGNQIPLPAPKSGFITRCDAEAIGRAALLLGAGRAKTTDTIDHAVGLSNLRENRRTYRRRRTPLHHPFKRARKRSRSFPNLGTRLPNRRSIHRPPAPHPRNHRVLIPRIFASIYCAPSSGQKGCAFLICGNSEPGIAASGHQLCFFNHFWNQPNRGQQNQDHQGKQEKQRVVDRKGLAQQRPFRRKEIPAD